LLVFSVLLSVPLKANRDLFIQRSFYRSFFVIPGARSAPGYLFCFRYAVFKELSVSIVSETAPLARPKLSPGLDPGTPKNGDSQVKRDRLSSCLLPLVWWR